MKDTVEESSTKNTNSIQIASTEDKNEDELFKAPQEPSPIQNKLSQDVNLKNLDVSAVSAMPQLNYTTPEWACEPPADMKYGFDVIKNGTLVETIEFSSRRFPTYIVIGRLDTTDIKLNHPSISRYHCVLQYGEDIMGRTGKGWHLYDLGSTHGTKLNKRRVPPNQYIRIRVGHVMQLGGSSRILNLIGPSTDTEAELEYSPTELRKRNEEINLAKMKKTINTADTPVTTSDSKDESFYDSDYDDEYLYTRVRDDYETCKNDEKYQKDPLKVLSHFFEHEGFDMVFSFTEVGTESNRKWCCTIELPVDTAAGQSLSASATCEGGKKKAQIACALNACRILDMHGILYRSTNIRRRAEKALAENDYYYSDEDTFLDRTGQIEKSRENRKRRALEAQGKFSEETDTYEKLLKKICGIEEEMKIIDERLLSLSATESDVQRSLVEDDVDACCRKLESTKHDSLTVKAEKSQHRLRLTELKHEKERLEKLAKIVKPVSLPELKSMEGPASGERHTAGVPAVMMKKIMQLRRNKKEAAEMRFSEDNIASVCNCDNDEKPFVVEEEEVEKGTLSGTYAACVMEPTVNADDSLNDLTKESLTEGKDPDKRALTKVLNNEVASKKRRVRIRGERGEKKMEHDNDYLNYNDDYITWMPPDTQTGDGKTSLNAKFAGKY